MHLLDGLRKYEAEAATAKPARFRKAYEN